MWNYVASNGDRLKCSLIHNPSTSTYAFLKYDDFAGTFVDTASVLQSDMPSPLNSATTTQMGSITLGQNCDLFIYSGQVYTIGTQISSVSGISSTIQASSSDLQYIVAGSTLFASASGSYTSLRTLASHTNYWINSIYNQIVVWGSTATQNGTNSTYTVSQNIYIILDSGSAQVLQEISMTAYNSYTNRVQVLTSPELTKVLFEYNNDAANFSSTVMSVYSVDWFVPSASTLTLVNPSSYSTAVAGVNTFTRSNFHLGDYYLTVRSSTTESTYQFIGT